MIEENHGLWASPGDIVRIEGTFAYTGLEGQYGTVIKEVDFDVLKEIDRFGVKERKSVRERGYLLLLSDNSTQSFRNKHLVHIDGL